jgi:glycosyltransferase involved in cell wall biosynthesis
MPRVSIGLPVYNGQRFLRQTIESILAQTFGDFELIISDNGSSDETPEICGQYAALDRRIRYSRNAVNIGAQKNFNRAFELATGQYFRWSSADDLFAPSSLQACVDVLDNHPEAVLCYPRTVLIDGKGLVLRSYEENLDLRAPRAADRLRQALDNIRLVNVHYGLIRSEVLRRSGVFGTYPGADIVLLGELALHGQFWEIPQELFFRRMHEEASSAMPRESWKLVQEFCDPTTKGGLDLYYAKLRIQNLISISRAPLRRLEKIQSAWIVGRYAFKSRHVHVKEFVTAIGELRRKLRPSASLPATKTQIGRM